MPFKVVIRNDLSLAQLAEMSRNGQPVMKSPHIGNLYPNNLAIASLGIFINLYDRTIGERDKNAHPHLVIAGGQSEQVANPKLLTTHSRVEHQSQFFPDYFPVGQHLVRGHVRALQKTLPQAQFTTFTDYLRQNIDFVMAILEIATTLQPDKWERIVRQDGTITHKNSAPKWRPILTWEDVKSEGIYGLTDQNQGLIIPKTFFILLFGVVESVVKKTSEVYHLSGPVMFRYVEGMRSDLTKIYDQVRKHLAGLPEKLVFNIVPVADMRFAVTASHQKALNELVEAYLNFRHQEALCAQIIAMDNINDDYAISYEKNRFREKILNKKEDAIQRLRDAMGNCPNILYNFEQATFTSQYDLLRGEQLYVSPWSIETPIKDVAKAIQLLTKIADTLHKAKRHVFLEDTVIGGIKY